MKKLIKRDRIILIWCAAAIAVFCLFLAGKVSTPRPVVSGPNSQILSIEYYDEASNGCIEVDKYNEKNTLKILEGLSEKWTMSKSSGFYIAADDVILYIAVADQNSVKSICFKKNSGYTSEGNGYHRYRMMDADLALDALLNELNIHRLDAIRAGK